MDNGNKDNATQQIIFQSNNYNVTIIPINYSLHNMFFPNNDNDEYVKDQFRCGQESAKIQSVPQTQWSNEKVLITGENKKKVSSADQFEGFNDNLLRHRIPAVPNCYTNDTKYCQGMKNFNTTLQNWNHIGTSDTKGYNMIHDSRKEVIYEEINDHAGPILRSSVNANTILSAASSTQNEPFEGLVIPMCVYLHNKTVIIMEIEDTPNATCELVCQSIVSCEELGPNKTLAMQVFTLWMISPLLEIQLKPYSKPLQVRDNWRNLLEKYSNASCTRKDKDEPKLVFQRNIFFQTHIEEKIKDQRILELLYEECKYNILNGRYPSEIPHLVMLGGIQAREELGPYNPQVHTTQYFREEQSKFLPAHVRKSPTWTWLPISSKNSAEVKLLEQFKRIPSTATNRRLVKKYVEYCWSLPFYGAAFFEGQIEEPVRGLISLLTHQDIPVLIAINSRGLHIIDDLNSQVVLGLRFEEFRWDCSKPTRDNNPDYLPCLFIQFMIVENGARVSKMLQVFSRQASLMDTLITTYVSQLSQNMSNDEIDNKAYDTQRNADNDNHNLVVGNSGYASKYSKLSNKLSKLTLATFDDEGRCIGKSGSWSFSY